MLDADWCHYTHRRFSVAQNLFSYLCLTLLQTQKSLTLPFIRGVLRIEGLHARNSSPGNKSRLHQLTQHVCRIH
ncbi:hypothetical protein MTBSS4_780003 [Magnetospirillum sp. SS-4]|nr:hypothetical protein MTBSS4_780003 [Magnetospirillum sp. SS-4]